MRVELQHIVRGLVIALIILVLSNAVAFAVIHRQQGRLEVQQDRIEELTARIEERSCILSFDTRNVIARILTLFAQDSEDTQEEDERERVQADRVENELRMFPGNCSDYVNPDDIKIHVTDPE